MNHAGMKRVTVYALLTGMGFLLLSIIPSVTQLQSLDQFFASRSIDWSRTREYMVMSKADTLKMAIAHFMNGSIIFYLIFFIPIIGYLFHARMVTRDMLILLVVQLLFCLAISVIAVDYGRWLSFLMMSFFICLFSYHDLNDFGERIRRSAGEKRIYVVLLLFMLSMYLPHYVKNYDLPSNIAEYSFWKKINYSVSEVIKENQ
jgi:hypothetical protein